MSTLSQLKSSGVERLVKTQTKLAFALFVFLATSHTVFAESQDSGKNVALPAAVETEPSASELKASAEDLEMEHRIEAIFSNIETLANIEVEVNSGVVSLSGTVANDEYSGRAKGIVDELSGVIAVESAVETTLNVQSNVTPLFSKLKSDLRRLIRSLPVFGIALMVFLLISVVGHLASKMTSFWSRIAHNPFIGELLAHAVKIASIAIGLVVALNIVGANSIIGTVLGGAGVIGLAIGFAVKDSLENYISSIMLSLRQPFRSKDRVKIGDLEGVVVRLTSRATVLMTPEGNHLRIPNSTVFKANIVNFSTNPERRFEFSIAVANQDDALVAMNSALIAVRALKFVLQTPKANATIDKITDSGAIISFTGWIDQSKSDFGRCRSLALLTVQDVVEQSAKLHRAKYVKTLEPTEQEIAQGESGGLGEAVEADKFPWSQDRQKLASSVLDVKADTHLEQCANQDRLDVAHTDLLNEQMPIE